MKKPTHHIFHLTGNQPKNSRGSPAIMASIRRSFATSLSITGSAYQERAGPSLIGARRGETECAQQDKPEAQMFNRNDQFRTLPPISSIECESSIDLYLATYAAERAALLLGCYRKGDAENPDTYTAAI